MQLFAQWQRWFRRAESYPLLLRVYDVDGRVCPSVRIDGVWLPSGRRFSVTPMVAQGLCLLPWSANAERLEATIIAAGGSARVQFERTRREPHQAHAVRVA